MWRMTIRGLRGTLRNNCMAPRITRMLDGANHAISAISGAVISVISDWGESY